MESGDKKSPVELEREEQEKWEGGGYYGENPGPMDTEMAEAWNRAKDKVHPTSIRIPPGLLAELRTYAANEGLGLHALIRMLLTRAVRERKSA